MDLELEKLRLNLSKGVAWMAGRSWQSNTSFIAAKHKERFATAIHEPSDVPTHLFLSVNDF